MIRYVGATPWTRVRQFTAPTTTCMGGAKMSGETAARRVVSRARVSASATVRAAPVPAPSRTAPSAADPGVMTIMFVPRFATCAWIVDRAP
jgi:hypothetical protein